MVVIGYKDTEEERAINWRCLINLRESLRYYIKDNDINDPAIRKTYNKERKIYRRIYEEYIDN